MKKTLLICILVLGVISCKNNDKFTVSGNIKNAEGKKLFLEYAGLDNTRVIDSLKLDESGNFDFKSARPAFPDFYNLRLENKTILFAVDSCEAIHVESGFENFSTHYQLSGSQTSNEIKTLRLSVINIQRKLNTLAPDMSADQRNALTLEIERDIEIHKTFARKLILANPRSLAAYYAIYQRVNNSFLFSPYVKADKPYCAAVATSFINFMPEYIRSKSLYTHVMDAIKNERSELQKAAWKEVMETQGAGYIDIALYDKNRTIRKLSALVGKVILIDFSSYQSEQSVEYTFALRELYNKYHSRGLEIYQVSLDENKLFWEKSISSIPWICVRDENGANTKVALSYNIQSLPTNFLMNRKGTIIARSPDFKELKNLIEQNL